MAVEKNPFEQKEESTNVVSINATVPEDENVSFEVADDGARIFSGVLIEELYGPANDIYAIGKAGALPGDVIKKINNEKIATLDQLITILRSKRAGDEITVEILRNENVILLDFTLDLRPSDV